MYIAESPMVLADFLLPGHETWCGIQASRVQAFTGARATPRFLAREAETVAALGYVPVVFADLPMSPAVRAAESWRRSVPADLVLPAVVDRSPPVTPTRGR